MTLRHSESRKVVFVVQRDSGLGSIKAAVLRQTHDLILGYWLLGSCNDQSYEWPTTAKRISREGFDPRLTNREGE